MSYIMNDAGGKSHGRCCEPEETQINLDDNLEDRFNYVQVSAQINISILSSQTLVHAIIACDSSV